MDQQHLSAVTRPMQVAAGVAVGIAGLLSLVIVAGALLMFLNPHEDPTNAAIVGSLFLVLGLPATFLSYRLIRGGARPADGGLLGPTLLRVAGYAFLGFPALSLYAGGWHWVLGLVHVGASYACFWLARYRERLRFIKPPAS
jgi:O-antigen/teichoic acid export membrane protein